MNYLKRILCVLGHEDYDYEAKLLTWAGELLYDKLRHEKYAKTFNYVYQKIYFG